MLINKEAYEQITTVLNKNKVQLVAVSKTKPVSAIMELYELGHRDFGENYVQELVDKQTALPKDIRWHFIGHLQSNKVKYIAPFVHLIHGVDSLKLLVEINKQALKNAKIVDCLLQMHIAGEDTKFGMDESELNEAVEKVKSEPGNFTHIVIRGLMGMASFSEDQLLVRNEFRQLKVYYDQHAKSIPSMPWHTLSMGMSSDYSIAVEEGSTMVRIGSLLFGERNYQQ
ncbi:MAG: YggS family pyridoxal phosphate-dependent enzyme [Chitinophagaceae bacterium]|nr:MAG: YggS family pyridoxal phosphate-dependent enzyme [Chitinophagaceae bacterium]